MRTTQVKDEKKDDSLPLVLKRLDNRDDKDGAPLLTGISGLEEIVGEIC